MRGLEREKNGGEREEIKEERGGRGVKAEKGKKHDGEKS